MKRLLWVCALIAACGDDDGSLDAGVDAGNDAGSDAAFDSGTDAGDDAGQDGGRDATFDTGLPESCAPNADGFGADEDGDARIDEGCDLAFGEPHPLTIVHVSTGAHFSPELSADGLTLYFAQDGVYRAERSARDAPFGRAEQLLAGPAETVTVLDENEYYVEVAGEIVPVIDGVRQEALDVSLPTRTVDRATHPSISRDGLDLWVSAEIEGNRDILLSRRRNLSESFETWTPVFGGPNDDAYPRISTDRLTIYFTRNDTMTMVSSREGPTTTVFTAPVELVGLPDGSVQPFHDPVTRELFFVRTGSPAWSPASSSLWRAQVCRDGACSEDPPACPSGVTSPDGLRCYSVSEAASEYDAIDCGSASAATVHSADEITALESLRDTAPTSELFWLGGRRSGADQWESFGEPFLYGELDVADPDGCFALRVDTPRWITTTCTNSHRAFCESQTWPSWTAP